VVEDQTCAVKEWAMADREGIRPTGPLARLAPFCEGGLRLVASAFPRRALRAREFLPASSSRSHGGLPFEFGHDTPPREYYRWLAALGCSERLSLVRNQGTRPWNRPSGPMERRSE